MAPALKRPKSAYLFFCLAHRPTLVTQGLSFADVSKKLSELWKEASVAERERFEEEARADKLRYQEERESSNLSMST